MKRYLLSITLLLLFFLQHNTFTFAQSFPETGASSRCSNCIPHPAYTVVSSPTGVSVSDTSFFGSAGKWADSNGNLVNVQRPPSSKKTGAVNSNSVTFLSLTSTANSSIDGKVKFKVGDFIPGQKYKMRYAVMATRSLGTNFGSEAILEIETPSNPNNLFGAIVDLALAKNQWQEMIAEFTATSDTLIFILSGNTAAGTGIVNFDIAYRPLDCILPPGAQVQLYSPKPSVMYPCETVNLDLLVKAPWPVGAEIVWKQGAAYSFAPNIGKFITEHAGVNANPYFAFYYHNANDCYSLDPNTKSTAAVMVTHSPQQVPLTQGSTVAVTCPSTSFWLKNKLALASDDSRVRWFNNNSHQGSPIAASTVTSPGTYYAFFYSNELGCYSTDISTSSVTVSFETPCCKAGMAQVSVQPATISNTCPASTADLTKTTLNANVPLNTQLVWFNNATHTGSPIGNPAAVGAGTYYAFIYDPAVPCYNTDNSTAQVKVTTTLCASNVQLGLKVALQGAMPTMGTKMKNDLQKYGGTGLLPTSAPYVSSSAYPNINSVAGPAGEVVDWVLVEVRSGSSPQTVLQSKSLLLKPDGSIVDRNGQVPTFNPQSGSVRLAIKHRNHLTVLSNPIMNFGAGASLSYDFTTSLSQASNAFGDPPQMVQKNGMWCMLPGDLNAMQDFFVDGVDGSFLKVQFKADVYNTYDRADINMDGFVDGVDGSLFNTSFYQDIYSTLINY
ncbi:hypothetical protein [Dyadobacter sp. BHUBP1]|uniref:hypothetical protein n=1 Tax=Dyadobacter sp. BHUBP1 TaxID=3424178 RepID=UPI003D348A60